MKEFCSCTCCSCSSGEVALEKEEENTSPSRIANEKDCLFCSAVNLGTSVEREPEGAPMTILESGEGTVELVSIVSRNNT